MPLRRIFYGWYVVVAMLVITTATSGLVFYNLSILLAAFADERGFPIGLASAATAVFFVASGVGGMIAGRLMDHFDARVVIAVAATLASLVLAGAGLLREVWQLFAFHLVFGLCHGAAGLVPVTMVVARWFHVRRALAFSIASTGLSLGGILISPFMALLVQRVGLAGAAPWMGLALFLGVVPVALLVLRSGPESMGLAPDDGAAATSASGSPAPAVAFAQARRTVYFLAVSTAYLFLLGAQVGAIAHFYRLASTRDGVETAALALAALATCSALGRLAGGWLLQRVSSNGFAKMLMLVQSLALAALAVADSRAQLLACAVLFGLTIGNSLMMHPLLLVERFGTRDYGRIYSLSQMVTVIGVAGCPALMGALAQASGGYIVPCLVVSAITALGLGVLIWGSSDARAPSQG